MSSPDRDKLARERLQRFADGSYLYEVYPKDRAVVAMGLLRTDIRAILTALTHPREERVSIADETLSPLDLAESLQWHMHEGPGIPREQERELVDQLVAALSSTPTPIDGEDGQ